MWNGGKSVSDPEQQVTETQAEEERQHGPQEERGPGYIRELLVSQPNLPADP